MAVLIKIIIFYQIFSLSISDRLVFLYTHFRHGARAPLDIDNNFKDKLGEHWPNPGELTGIGQRMHYLLGLRNRLRYIKNENFLSEKFDPHQIIIFSSNLNRTMVSVSSQLQGLYPQKDEQGETLTATQQEIAYPQVNCEDNYIQEALEDLGENALPYKMTLAPVRMSNDLDRKFNVYDIEECKAERDETKQKNNENIEEWIEYLNDFNEEYAESLNKFFGTEGKTYSISELNDICDSFLSDYWDGRNMTNFYEKTGLDFVALNEDCFDFFRQYYLYSFHGDSEKTLAHVDSSKIMRELLFYMKRRLDADMSSTDEDANYKDYSYPRMVMNSGHDSTVSADQIFIINALGLNQSDIYIFPKYASQLALEVRTEEDEAKASGYGDYTVVGYFDDKEIFNVKADEFMNKIESEIWSDQKISDFCGFDDSSNSGTNNSTNNDDDGDDKAKTAYKVLMSVFICLSAVLLAACIFLGYKLSKANKPLPPIDKNYNPNASNVTENNLKQ